MSTTTTTLKQAQPPPPPLAPQPQSQATSQQQQTSQPSSQSAPQSTRLNMHHHHHHHHHLHMQHYCICSKFVPQAFNTNKCQQCFNFKEVHSQEALAEFSKSNRKICKYGYLFIAPPDLELNKTKRWQWRFFIYYDDGELTYSLDENPLTIPQGRVNMTQCDKITEFINDLTTVSYPYTLCLHFPPPNKDIYIAAGNYEEFLKWRDVLISNSMGSPKSMHNHLHNHHPHPHANQHQPKPVYMPSKCVTDGVDEIDNKSSSVTTSTQVVSSSNPTQQPNSGPSKRDYDHGDIVRNIDDDDDEDEDDDEEEEDEEDDDEDEDECEDEMIDRMPMAHHMTNEDDCDDEDEVDDEEDEVDDIDEHYAGDNDEDDDDEDEEDEIDDGLRRSSNAAAAAAATSGATSEERRRFQRSRRAVNAVKKNSVGAAKINKAIKQAEVDDTNSVSNNNNLSNTNGSNSSSSSNQSSSNAATNSTNNNNNNNNNSRRLSYKEDDLLRKQRLKENLNQLLIEYKHEEEAQMKKQLSTTTTTTTTNRTSLDSSKPNRGSGGGGAFSLVVAPVPTNGNGVSHHQQQIINSHSAFRPVTSLTNLNNNNSHHQLSTTTSSSTATNPGQSQSNGVGTKLSKAHSSSSVVVPSSNSSSSASPPVVSTSSTTTYKKPCLISPSRKSEANECCLTSSSSSALANSSSSSSSTTAPNNKSLTIVVGNNTNVVHHNMESSANVVDSSSSTSSSSTNLSGYLWKSKDSSSMSSLILGTSSSSGVVSGGSSMSGGEFSKYWFSLSPNLASLVYWLDKHEQDIGKYPLGKYELLKCSSVSSQQTSVVALGSECNLEFRVQFHQGQGGFICLRASTVESKLNWCDAIRRVVESSAASVCSKCKPKLVVNPMPLQPSPSSNATINNQPTNTTASNQPSDSTSHHHIHHALNHHDDNMSSSATLSNSTAKRSLLSTTQSATNGVAKKNGATTLGASSASQSGANLHTINKHFSKNSLLSDLNSTSSATTTSSSSSNLTTSSSANNSSQQTNPSTTTSNTDQLEHLRHVNERLSKENLDLSHKFKLLEQIHVDTVAEYDKQHARLYSQLDDLHSRLHTTEHELTTIRQQHQQQQQQQQQQQSDGSWNKEVKSLDARISDVLGKIREREMSLGQTSGVGAIGSLGVELAESRLKCERLQSQLADAHSKIAQLSQQVQKTAVNSSSSASSSNTANSASSQLANLNIQDFSDDLAKVLMSKEEVITQLERQLKEKEAQIGELSTQLSEEMSQSNRFQDAFNLELSRNTQLTHLNANLNEHFSDELTLIKHSLAQSQMQCESLQCALQKLSDEKSKCELELKNLQDYSKNEIETLQEEVKTLEFKLVHSQRQAQEYQQILEEMDSSNSSLLNQLSQVFVSNGGSLATVGLTSLSELNTANLQQRLKRNQQIVASLIQHIMQQKSAVIDELNKALNQLQNEFDEIKEENIDLNDHIYSIDVFMREKEQQSEQLQKDKDTLLSQIAHLRSQLLESENNANKSDVNNATSTTTPDSSSSEYDRFLSQLHSHLTKKTRALGDFIKVVNHLSSSSNTTTDGESILAQVDAALSGDSRRFSPSKSTSTSISVVAGGGTHSLADALKSLLQSSELHQFNAQIVSYMGEQLIHKAALNGYLKFACDLLRKKLKFDDSSSSVNGSKQESKDMMLVTTVQQHSEQDEKLLKLASELLLSDEDSLKNLSAQLLNEAKHLTQLNCVLSTLNKIRNKYLKQAANGCLEQLDSAADTVNGSSTAAAANSPSSLTVAATTPTPTDDSSNVNYILEVIQDIFVQHKVQISDQLNEMRKLMCISSDDDLITHLQNENSTLQTELAKLKEQLNSTATTKTPPITSTTPTTTTPPTSSTSSSEKKQWLQQQTSGSGSNPGGSQLRKFGLLTTDPGLNPAAQKLTSSSTSGSKSALITDSTHHHHHHHHHHHILTDLLSQDDTMC